MAPIAQLGSELAESMQARRNWQRNAAAAFLPGDHQDDEEDDDAGAHSQ